MHHTELMAAFSSVSSLVALPIAALFAVACGSGVSERDAQGHALDAPNAGSESTDIRADSTAHRAADSAETTIGYRGPSVGAATGFAVLAQNSITALSNSPVTGNLGVSGAPVFSIKGFDAVPVLKFGTDSSAPNSLRTILTQREVDALVDDIDVRACDADYTNVARGATGDITIRPGVTCLNDSNTDLLVHGRITLDADNDPDAFFVIRSNFTLTVSDATNVVLINGAQACGVFWRAEQQVSIGSGVQFFGTVIAGTGITMQSGSTLVGRALARTAAVVLDGNSISLPLNDTVASAGTCTHLQ
jgi:hypothetical protein